MRISEAQASTQYREIARIGRGGIAEILLAAAQTSGVTKLAVLKCLWPEVAEDAELIQIFLDEASVCARLAHPNVVQTHAVLRHEGRLAMAMEYLDGQPLAAVLSRLGGANALALPTRVRILLNVLAGLEYAHNLVDFNGTPLGVIHRDVSPQNVFITYDGHVKLIDFGLAKTLAQGHHTRPGSIKGKLAYLAPEAIRGGAVDRRADVFSVGVLLWELLAGRSMWDYRSESEIAWQLASGVRPPALPKDIEVPEPLRVICERALAIDPNERQQSAGELEAELASVWLGSVDSHPKRLGQIVASAFEEERAQRQALIEAHLRLPSPRAARARATGPGDYDAIEVTMSGLTVVHEKPDLVRPHAHLRALRPRARVLPPPLPRTARARAPRAVIASVVVAAALVCGAVIGREIPRGRELEATQAAAATLVAPPQPAFTAMAASPATRAAEALPDPPIDEPSAPRATSRKTRASRDTTARPVRSFVFSDEVLDPEGRPTAEPAPPRTIDVDDPFNP
jgi:serine/threonine-protein kinase